MCVCVCLWSHLLCSGPSHDRGKAGGGGRSAGRAGGGVQRRGPQSGGGNAYNQSAGQAYVSFLSSCHLCFSLLALLFTVSIVSFRVQIAPKRGSRSSRGSFNKGAQPSLHTTGARSRARKESNTDYSQAAFMKPPTSGSR